MNEGSLREVLDGLSDTEAGSVVRGIWRARGYEAAIRFSGPDLYVEARGRTEEGATRRIRSWVATGGRIDRRRMRAFANACDRDGAEPHVVTLGTAAIDDDAHRSGLWEFDASRLAVEVRDVGVEPAVRELGAEATDEGGEAASEDWFGDPVADDAGEDGRDGGSDGDDAEDGEELTRRDAARIAGKYVVVGLVTYLFVEGVSDAVRAAPELRRRVREATAPLQKHVPAMPSGEAASASGGDGESGTGTPDYGNPTSGERVENATTIPYDELAADPEGFAGSDVRYDGVVKRTVEGVTERGVRLAVTPGPNGTWSDELACRWPTGRLYGDAVRFRLLEGERIRIWGTVRGATAATRTERSVPRVEVVGIAAAES